MGSTTVFSMHNFAPSINKVTQCGETNFVNIGTCVRHSNFILHKNDSFIPWVEKYLTTKAQTNSSIASHVDYRTVLQRICYSHWANGARNGVISIEQWGMFNHEKGAI